MSRRNRDFKLAQRERELEAARRISQALFQRINVDEDARHFTEIDALTGYKTRDMIVLPLQRWEGNSIGVLKVLNKRDGWLNEDDLSILTIISAIAAAAIEDARLFEGAKLGEMVSLVANISHDVKNLLTPVILGVSVLDTEFHQFFGTLPDIEPTMVWESHKLCDEVISMHRESTRRIKDRMREITDCVMGLSTPLCIAPCQVACVVEDVIKTLRMYAHEKGVSLRTEGLDALPSIVADERRLFNAFYNLVNNAIPEVPPAGSITMSGRVEPEAGAILLSVADTGRGMPPEIRESLFTAHTISRKIGGTGLGLKIVKDVVDAHGGRIAVESKNGAGTTFLIHLPLKPIGSSAC